jgi:hypothetical protein
MAYRIQGTTVISDDRRLTVDSASITTSDRVNVGVTSSITDRDTWLYQGSNFGYAATGAIPATEAGFPGASPAQFPLTRVDRFPFAADVNATNIADVVIPVRSGTGITAQDAGYLATGIARPDINRLTLRIEKIAFANDTTSTVVGSVLSVSGTSGGGHSSKESGFVTNRIPNNTATYTQKFPFYSELNSSFVGDYPRNRFASNVSNQSTTHAYISGHIGVPVAESPDPVSSDILKFPFYSDYNVSTVGNLSQTRTAGAGQSSTTHGYTSGGSGPPISPGVTSTIDKFPFSSEGLATNVGSLTQERAGQISGQSSTISGYSAGGNAPTSTPIRSNVIDKFPFASDSNATDVGDLTQGRYNVLGFQY